MKLAALMLATAYVYLLLRLANVFPKQSHSCVYFAMAMGLLCTINLVREWRDYRHES